MKVTKRQLRQIIKEERAKLVREQAGAFLLVDTLNRAKEALTTAYEEVEEEARDAGYEGEEISEIAFRVVMELVDEFANEMGHHSRTGRPM